MVLQKRGVIVAEFYGGGYVDAFALARAWLKQCLRWIPNSFIDASSRARISLSTAEFSRRSKALSSVVLRGTY